MLTKRRTGVSNEEVVKFLGINLKAASTCSPHGLRINAVDFGDVLHGGYTVHPTF
jgi:hypothetical protein